MLTPCPLTPEERREMEAELRELASVRGGTADRLLSVVFAELERQAKRIAQLESERISFEDGIDGEPIDVEAFPLGTFVGRRLDRVG
jgi:hypothetical protein